MPSWDGLPHKKYPAIILIADLRQMTPTSKKSEQETQGKRILRSSSKREKKEEAKNWTIEERECKIKMLVKKRTRFYCKGRKMHITMARNKKESFDRKSFERFYGKYMLPPTDEEEVARYLHDGHHV